MVEEQDKMVARHAHETKRASNDHVDNIAEIHTRLAGNPELILKAVAAAHRSYHALVNQMCERHGAERAHLAKVWAEANAQEQVAQ